MTAGKDNSFAGFYLDTERKILRCGGEIVRLPPKAVELLIVLFRNRGEVVTKDELLDEVWDGTFVEESVLSNNIYILRKTLAELGTGKDLIKTVPRRGYCFVSEPIESNNESELVAERHVFRETSTGEISGEFSDRQPKRNQTPPEFEFLQNLDRKASESTNSIAVLPLVNDSGDAELDYLSDGIAESLIDNLSYLPRLRVIARTTVFRYKSTGGDRYSPQQIGAELDVEAIVTGRIRLFKNNLSIKIELVRTLDGAQLWGENYLREFDDIFDIQAEIAREITGKLRLKLSTRETKFFARGETTSSEAFQYYLKGRYFWNKRAAEWMKKGIDYFQQALDCDPNYAPAYCGLADSYISFATIGALSPGAAIPKARAAAQKALEINDRSAEAHAALGFIKNSYDWDFQAADKHFRRAAEINPNYSIAYHWHGFCLLAQGKFAESIELMKTAQALDPLSPIINTVCGLPFYYMRRYDRAIQIYEEVLETDASFFPGYAYLAMAYEQIGQNEDAVSTLHRALSYSPDNTFALASLGHVYAVSGREKKARETIEYLRVLAAKKYVSPYGMAEIYTALDEKEQALAELEKAAAERSWWLIFAGVNPRFDKLRPARRFLNILKKINLDKFQGGTL
ncbi:MAG TPA: tetratricopeptide repeat protein [Pyrinomonadaceae bacterium]|nr:tetratricopeptide repeat protein [Pyrinomonadaceae bacterium]